MRKTIDTLIDQTEECLRRYAEKQNWTPEDVMCVKNAVSSYEKLMRLVEDCETANQEGMSMRNYHSMRASMARGRDANTGRYVSRAPRYYEYDGSMTAYGRDGSYGDPYMNGGRHQQAGMYSGAPYAMNQGQGGSTSDRSMHSINDRMIQRLESMMDDAQTDYERNEIRETIAMLEQKRTR